MPGEDLARIYDRWGARLLEQNVRVFLQARSKVNKGIKGTLEHEPELFFSFNNGLTTTAEAVRISEDGNYILSMDNLQIVNGGQTTASIYAAYRAGCDLSKVFVQMKLNVIQPSDVEELVPPDIAVRQHPEQGVRSRPVLESSIPHPYPGIVAKVARAGQGRDVHPDQMVL